MIDTCTFVIKNKKEIIFKYENHFLLICIKEKNKLNMIKKNKKINLQYNFPFLIKNINKKV